MPPRDGAAFARVPLVTPKQQLVSRKSEEHRSKQRVVFPKSFLGWCAAKTLFQQGISFLSIMFIVESTFFPSFWSAYDGSVWGREALYSLFLPQAIFELIDLVFETWITLYIQKSSGHLPWDSILHHTFTSAYYFYVFFQGAVLDHDFLGLAAAGLSCQVIGIGYTIHRLGFRWRFNALMLVTVQLLWRCPLALASLYRAVQYYQEAPLAHFAICMILAWLDVRWTAWSLRLYKRQQQAKAIKQL